MKNKLLSFAIIAMMFFCGVGLASCGTTASSYEVAVQNAEHGQVILDKTSFEEGETLTLSCTADVGYELDHYFIVGGATLDADTLTMPAYDITISAVFKAIEYTISYQVDSETQNGNVTTYTIETADIALASPIKLGYDFDAWYTDNTYLEPCSLIESGTIGDLVLYPKWSLHTYSITYEIGDATNNENNLTSYTIETTDAITLYSPEKENYLFFGWYEDANFLGAKVTEIDPATLGDVTLYARFVCNEVDSEGYTLITSAVDLLERLKGSLATNDEQKLRLTCDIDLTNYIDYASRAGYTNAYYSPSYAFKGIFDGNGHKISGIQSPVDYHAYYYGFFGAIYNATIKNLTLSYLYTFSYDYAGVAGVAMNKVYVGGIAGSATGDNYIQNCEVYGTICFFGEVSSYVDNLIIGGMIGYVESASTATITNSIASNGIVGDGYIGGVIGEAEYMATMENCYVYGDFRSSKNFTNYAVGSFMALPTTYCTFTNCVANTTLTTNTDTASKCGMAYTYKGKYSNCYVLEDIFGVTDHIRYDKYIVHNTSDAMDFADFIYGTSLNGGLPVPKALVEDSTSYETQDVYAYLTGQGYTLLGS